MTDLEALKARISDEADLCRNEGATDIAALLDDTRYAIERLEAENAKLREELRQIYVDATEQHADWCNIGPVENEARDWVFDLSQYALAALKG